jgi:hypothetical protein
MNDPDLPSAGDPAAARRDPDQPHPHVEALVDQLAAEAAEILAERPELRLIGLVVERSGPWFRPFKRLIEEANGEPSKGAWLAAVVDRDPVFEALSVDGGQDAFLFMTEVAGGEQKLLPVVIAAAAGYQLGWAAPPDPDPEDDSAFSL